MTESPIGLAALERRVAHDLEILSYPGKPWVLPRTAPDGSAAYDVIIVGAGQGGLGTAFGLLREQVTNILVVDGRPEGHEGPWETFARMETLRTVKELIGPDNDQASLAFRSWYEARHGAAGWEKLVRIPRGVWMDYLRWFRRVTGVPVRNDTQVLDIRPEGELIRLTIATGGTLYARKLVLQTGLEGSGGPAIPADLAAGLPRHLWAHTSDMEIDWNRVRGGRVGIIGAGASAFDNALTALDRGVARCDQFARRKELPRINFMRGIEHAGFFRHFGDLDDLLRWRFMRQVYSLQVPPPPDTFERAVSRSGFHLHLGCPWTATRAIGDQVEVDTPEGRFRFDLVIFGTGFRLDIAGRPELQSILPAVARWSDRLIPPPGEEHAVLARQPYLGPTFELVEKAAGQAPWLHHIRFASVAAWASHGPVTAGVNGMKFGLARMIAGICRDLFCEDAGQHYATYMEYATPELTAPMPTPNG